MAVLRNVPKTFSFEEQRIEINEIAQDLYDLNVTASGIALTDISVVKPNPTASGSGDVTYDSSNGQFTYTPPELNFLTDLGDAIVDGDFTTGGLMKTDGAGNYSVIHDHSTEWDEAHDWGNHANAGYLTSLPSHTHDLEDLGDVTITGATIALHNSITSAGTIAITGAGSNAQFVDGTGALQNISSIVGNQTLAQTIAVGNTTGGTDISVSANDDIVMTDSSKIIMDSDFKIYKGIDQGKKGQNNAESY